MAHPPLPQQRPSTATTPASHHRHKPTSTNATLKKKKKHNQRDWHNHKSQTHRHHPKSQIHSTIPKSQITARWWQARSETLGRRDTAAFWPFSSWTLAMTMARAPWAANSRAVSSPMLLVHLVIMATLPWSLLFEDVECVLSLLREGLESNVRREKKINWRSERREKAE